MSKPASRETLLAENAALRAKVAALETRLSAVEQDQHQSHDLLAALFEQAPYAIQMFDRHGFLLRMNEASRQLLGIDELEYFVGKFNVLTDPFMRAAGHTATFTRAYAGEAVHVPEVGVN
ncbi:MAG TPA: hypothetical protein VFX76_16715, partial [Roseiflexaceae bacterium]|nr:hypothetical protein [Roseiflexaceae bacterium]